jgi:hypothetical protein
MNKCKESKENGPQISQMNADEKNGELDDVLSVWVLVSRPRDITREKWESPRRICPSTLNICGHLFHLRISLASAFR